MKALFKIAAGEGNLELREIPRPEAGDNEVLIKIEAAGICGSDLHHYMFGGLDASSHSLTIPVVLGHEFSGVIAAVGKGVSGWESGERIVSETHATYCGHCRLCRSGNYHLCSERRGYGSSVDGAFTEYISVPPRLLHRIPAEMSHEEATILQPAADIVNAVFNNSRITPGATVLVMGPGPMGILSAQVARICGAARVIVAGLSSDLERLKIAARLGADVTLNLEEEPLEKVLELTDGRGADVVLEASGSRRALTDSLQVLAKQGQLTVIGVPTQPVELPLAQMQAREQRLSTSIMSSWPDYERAIRLAESGRLKLKALITDVLPLTDFAVGFEKALAKKACKVVFVP